MDVETAISDVMVKANRAQSTEADFGKETTWTFRAPYLVVGAGEYVLIPRADWDEFLSNLRTIVEARK